MKRQWYFEAAGTQAGPIDESEVAAKIAGGVLGPDTLVWTNGQKNWMAAKETELAAHLTLRLSADRSTVRGGSGPEAMPSLTSASVDPSVGVRGDRASTGAIVGADPASAAGISSVGIAAHPTSRERERNQHKGNGLLVLGLGLLGIVVFIAVGVLSYEIGVVAGRSNAIGPAETASRPPPDPPTQSLPEAASSLQWPILKPGDWQKDVAQIETLMQSGDLPIEHAFGYPFFTQSDAEAAFQSWKFPLAKILDADTELEDNWVWWVDLIRADLSTAFPPTMDFYF